jgi:DNA-binding transcriptional LysR family regulator
VRAARTPFEFYGRRGRFTTADFATAPYIASPTQLGRGALDATTLDAWPADWGRAARYEMEGLEAALETCRQGLAIGYFPRYLIKLHNERVRSELQLDVLVPPARFGKGRALDIYLVRRAADEDEPPALKRLAKVLRAVCR